MSPPSSSFIYALQRLILLILLPLVGGAALAQEITLTPAPEGAQVYFIAPQNGQTLSNPILVQFGLKGMGVAPAGIDAPNTGHHHLLVNTALPPAGQPIPTDETHLHFGLGQTETTLTLPPGPHELQILLGDHAHIPHQPMIASERIMIIVEE